MQTRRNHDDIGESSCAFFGLQSHRYTMQPSHLSKSEHLSIDLEDTLWISFHRFIRQPNAYTELVMISTFRSIPGQLVGIVDRYLHDVHCMLHVLSNAVACRADRAAYDVAFRLSDGKLRSNPLIQFLNLITHFSRIVGLSCVPRKKVLRALYCRGYFD